MKNGDLIYDHDMTKRFGIVLPRYYGYVYIYLLGIGMCILYFKYNKIHLLF